ncbi:MAG: GntR family transcriptional regulator [Pseudomonadota bacterium]
MDIPDQTTVGARPTPRYVAIKHQIALAIDEGSLPRGTILMEGPIATIFGTSRTPVRTALNELCDGGLISRFEGRGFVVGADGEVKPHRTPVTRSMLGLREPPSAEPPPASADRIARTIEKSLVLALPFGLHRINEKAVADHFDVSRTVVRELFSRYQDRGLIRKDRSNHWTIGPLTARDVSHFFAIRGRLEPLALMDSAAHISGAEIARMRRDLDEAMDDVEGLDADRIDALETDIHITLLAQSPNASLLRMIQQSHIALVVNQVFASFVGPRPFEIAFREHAMILDFLTRGSHAAAAQNLEEHIRLSSHRTRQRLMAISVFPEPELPHYLVRQTL